MLSLRKGAPVDKRNIARRQLNPIGERLGFHLSWHVFRRTHVTLAEETGSTAWPQQVSQTPALRSWTRRKASTAGLSNSTGWVPESPSNEAVEHSVKPSFVRLLSVEYSQAVKIK